MKNYSLQVEVYPSTDIVEARKGLHRASVKEMPQEGRRVMMQISFATDKVPELAIMKALQQAAVFFEANAGRVVDPLVSQADEPAQVTIEREVLTEDGKTQLAIEHLKEGEEIVEEGRRYRVVENQLGTLYKKSVDPLGQVGGQQVKKLTMAEFREQMKEYARQQLGYVSPTYEDRQTEVDYRPP